MEKIQGVSLPRCGHNLLVQHLQQYFEHRQICPDYRKKLLPFLAKAKMRRDSNVQRNSETNESPFHYCEYYYSCKSYPCCDARNNFQKSHDFDLKLPVNTRQKYIIQTRNDLGLLISWFELRLPRKREVDSPQGFVNFANRIRPYLDGFRRKWLQSELPQRLAIDYDDYLHEPKRHLAKAIRQFAPDQPINVNRLREITSNVRPRQG